MLQLSDSLKNPTGGIGRVISELVSSLEAAGIAVVVEGPNPIAQGGTDRVANLLSILPAVPGLMKALRNSPSIVHIHGYTSPYPMICALAARILQIPTVYNPNLHPFGNSPRSIRRGFDFFIGRIIFSLVDRVVVLTDSERDLVARLNAKARGKVVMVGNAIPRFVIDDEPSRPQQRSPGRILYVGRLEPSKGIRVMMAALDVVLDGMPEASLTIATPGGSLLEHVRKWSTEWPGRVTILLSPEDVELKALYDSSWVLLVPSLYEAFGMVALEGMARGIPIIGTDVGGLRMLLGKQERGLVVPANDAVALVRALREMLRSLELHGTYARSPREFLHSFAPERVAQEYAAIYQTIVSSEPICS